MPHYNFSYQEGPSKDSLRPSPKALQLAGPILPVQIEVPIALADQLQKSGDPIPSPVLGCALIDTGATVSCVAESVVAQLGVQPVGTANIGTAGGPQQKATYPARFIFPGTNLPPIDFSQLVGSDLSGQQIPYHKQPLIALVGRDLMTLWTIYYNGPYGMFTIAF